MTTAARELVRAVSIGEGVKQIVVIAGRVRSIATNAILLAHRAGDLARGFGVLSRELRGFTDQVTVQMNVLSDCTFQLASEVSGMLRQTHRTQILRRTHDMLGDQQAQAAGIGAILARHAAEREDRTRAISKLHERLDGALAATDQVVQFGTVLARTALIEAAYGGEHSLPLSGVAREFSQTIDQIIDALHGVRRASHASSQTPADVTS